MTYTHDAIVIGGGAAGLTAAGGLAMFGRKVALIEAGEMGGECLNNGCVPSKALIAAAAKAHHAETARFGVTPGGANVDFSGVHAHVHGAIATIAPHDSQTRFEEMGAQVYRERAKLVGGGKVTVGERIFKAPRIVIATGSRPFIPPIEGVDQVPYLTNETIFDLKTLPKHLIIVGAGAIGMEMGQSFHRLGSEVTIIAPGRPMPRDDEEAALLVKSALADEGVRFVTGFAQKALKMAKEAGGDILVDTSGGEVISGSHLLIAAGRKANLDGLGLAAAGVEFGKHGIIVDDRRRTSNKKIYAIGDCREGPRLTHVAGYEGSNVVLEIATGIPAKVDWKALPWCTFTAPELAQIGMTEADARAKYGDKISVAREGFDHNDRAITEGNTAGFIKMVMKGKKVIGATIVGAGAGEMLLPISQMITGKASSFALGSAVVAYPTRGEITKAASFAAWEPTVFGPIPKKLSGMVAALRRKF